MTDSSQVIEPPDASSLLQILVKRVSVDLIHSTPYQIVW